MAAIAVVDPSSAHPLAKAVAAYATQGDRLMGVCFEVSDIESTAARIGSTVMPGARTYADGAEVAWRLSGIEAALAQQRPFFIQWDKGRTIRTGQVPAQHRVSLTGALRVELGGSEDVLREWIGGPVDAVGLVGGTPGVRRIIIGTDEGDHVIE